MLHTLNPVPSWPMFDADVAGRAVGRVLLWLWAAVATNKCPAETLRPTCSAFSWSLTSAALCSACSCVTASSCSAFAAASDVLSSACKDASSCRVASSWASDSAASVLQSSTSCQNITLLHCIVHHPIASNVANYPLCDCAPMSVLLGRGVG